MEDGVFVLVDLAQQGTNLHVSFAFVFQHLQTQRRLFGVAEVPLHVVALKVVQTGFEADGALLKNTQLLVTHGHVMQSEQKHELVVFHLVCLYLVKHRLSLLEQDQCFFKLFLRNEV